MKEGDRRRQRSSHTADGLSDPSKQKNINWCLFLYLHAALMMKLWLYHPEKLINNVSFSHWVSEERSFHPHPPESHPAKDGPLNCFGVLVISLCRDYFWLSNMANRDAQRREGERVMREGERDAHRTPPAGSVWDLGPWGPLDGSSWMGALARWPGSLRTGYEGKGMLLLRIWPPDPLSNVCLGSFETQHIYLQRSEERGRSGCQNKVIVLLTASSAAEGQLWQAHNVAASAGPGRGTVICGHAGNLATISPPSLPPLPSSLNMPELFLWILFFVSIYQDNNWVTWELLIALCSCTMSAVSVFPIVSFFCERKD